MRVVNDDNREPCNTRIIRGRRKGNGRVAAGSSARECEVRRATRPERDWADEGRACVRYTRLAEARSDQSVAVRESVGFVHARRRSAAFAVSVTSSRDARAATGGRNAPHLSYDYDVSYWIWYRDVWLEIGCGKFAHNDRCLGGG
ncbi:unnamed protein product [Arctia plantaginis]|uniref:Uncharacterized protein n=1 Tax=Arctia plantaginis TaxID=874455 RepID=A0A8S1B3W1_ARCPL|nr:unnamed protein product [Arctia plantaginis]